VALLYPNTYPVALSNLGFQLVYSLLNRDEGVVCERFVYPADGHSLRSLESSRPLHDFPLVFGSISFEHDYPRLAAMLAAGGLPAYAAERGRTVGPGNPLVVLGGIGIFLNPEPLALFADLMVIGEAEPILAPLMQAFGDYAETPRDRLLLRIAATLPGCYAPGFYRFSWSDDGVVREIEAPAELPQRVARISATEAERAGHSTLLSPVAELDMYMVELGRGCSRGCRFCAAGFIYRPPRLWSAAAILAGLEERPPAVGRIGLLGMEMADSETVERIAQYLGEQGCSLSFSSLRADRISGRTLELLAVSNLKSAAIAADGASERLRRLINKGLSEDDLLAAAERLVHAGIFHLKLYVMIGLPTETHADLDELVRMVGRLQGRILPIGRGRGRVSALTLSVNCFIPKPWTPFQYCSFGGLTAAGESAATIAEALLALKGKIKYLRRMLSANANLHLKFDHPEQALQQAAYARADRRIGPVLLNVGNGWSFKQACRQSRIDPRQFAVRPRGREELMCWEVIDQGIRPGYLWEEYERALREQVTGPCEPALCRRCGVCRARS
jgi:Fe-S oxidoreductase